MNVSTQIIPSSPTTQGQQRPDHGEFICQATDGLWVAIEKALDNGFGLVFVVGADGALIGQLTLHRMRAALRDGLHLRHTTAAELAAPWEEADAALPIVPVTDSHGRVISVERRVSASLLPVAEPDLSRNELRNLLDAFLSTWISSTGDYILEFESHFSARVDMTHGVATSNGTVSLHLALAALGIGPGDEVIVPDLTFAASANTVIHVGARPVLVDVDPVTWCVSAEAIERAVTPRTRIIMPVHLFGRPAPMTEICDLAQRHGLFVLEDCAEAHGARYDGRPIGSFSDVASFSFFANKIITTGEGGMCVTRNPELASRMKMLRDHGMRPDRRYWHEEAGFNFRMTNLQASIGCAQLQRMDDLLAMRDRVDASYRAALADLPGVVFPPPLSSRHEPVTWFSCVLVSPEIRPLLIKACREANIDLRPFVNALSTMPAYRRFARKCPVSERLAACGINLPTSRKVDENVVGRIARIFEQVMSMPAAIASSEAFLRENGM
ncbi:aminotransferase class I/II-fold pyridoxal phosphate-dependent enzyme [Sinorhizobium fredii]|uniref:aminotransferase class I/II-fold pyridoxal phosphate-dependent enzyme n=1 Tax=Rhizobium fredii TaxID=380 RepID=UPI003514CF01